MACRPLKIGFLGPILETSSWHARWISRAIEIAESELPEFAQRNAELCIADDGASGSGGLAAAQMLLSKGIDTAAGLFSSSAAAAAIPLLEAGGCGVVIAGANLEGLTAAPGVFRVCDTTAEYGHWIASIVRRLPVREISMHLDSTAFGSSIGTMLPHGLNGGSERRGKAILCIGQFQFANRILQEQAASISPDDIVLLTDDCQSAHKTRMLANLLPGAIIIVAGFSVQPAPGRAWAQEIAVRRWGEWPGAFFHETIAAIEAAIHLARTRCLEGKIATVLGDLEFDHSGEARPQRMALYAGKGDGLIEYRTVDDLLAALVSRRD